MNRRQFLAASATATVASVTFIANTNALAAGKKNPAKSQPLDVPQEIIGPWATHQFQYEVKLGKLKNGSLWLPVPNLADNDYQKTLEVSWTGNFAKASLQKDESYGAAAFLAKWEQNNEALATLKLKVATRDRGLQKEFLSHEEKELFLRPTPHMPLDGIVKTTAESLSKKGLSDDQKAFAIYNWVVEHTFRDPKVKGCGVGDIKSMLESGNLGGKCADINAIFVGFCRASGIPAREVYGLRVAESKLFKSIGKIGDISKGQHCRGEYYSAAQGGWVPVDAADVRKVILEEKLDLAKPEVQALRSKFFGFWEMNWVAFNSARDFTLAESSDNTNYFMYPLALVDGEKRDSMTPETCGYKITSL